MQNQDISKQQSRQPVDYELWLDGTRRYLRIEREELARTNLSLTITNESFQHCGHVFLEMTIDGQLYMKQVQAPIAAWLEQNEIRQVEASPEILRYKRYKPRKNAVWVRSRSCWLVPNTTIKSLSSEAK